MNNYIFYSSHYLREHFDEDISPCLCDGHCTNESCSKLTHLLFSDSLKNLFSSFKQHFATTADSDLYSLYLYTVLTLPEEHRENDKIILVDSLGNEFNIKGRKIKYQQKISKEIVKLEQKLYEEEVVKKYCHSLEKLPSLHDLALIISEKEDIGFATAKRLADLVTLFFNHLYLPHEKNNEESSFNFYLRHKVPDNDDVTLVYSNPSDLKLTATKEQLGKVTMCDSRRRASA